MAGFRKAKSEQAALKIAIFGAAGSGKTFTALLIAEGLAGIEKKKIAYWDTEHGTDFYAMQVDNRQYHPAAFDFEAIYTRSITEGSKDLFALDPAQYGVVVIDSMTHLWEAAIAAYSGKKMSNGQIPMQAWSSIKKPYKALMQWMINSPMHVLILGRQANEWSQDDDTGETVASGVKMKAEGETAYEPHILLRMEGVKQKRDDGKSVKKNAIAIPTMFVIKDRTGILQGHTIEYPNFDTVAPIMGLLGKTQAKIETDDESSAKDVEALRQEERARSAESDRLKRDYLAKFELCRTKEAVEEVAKALTPDVKKKMRNPDLDEVREAYRKAAAGLPVMSSSTTPKSDTNGDVE